MSMVALCDNDIHQIYITRIELMAEQTSGGPSSCLSCIMLMVCTHESEGARRACGCALQFIVIYGGWHVSSSFAY